MGDVLPIENDAPKDVLYASAVQQIDKLLRYEPDLLANLSNITAILRAAFDCFWIGFYFRRDTDLVLGPFQGPMAHSRFALIPTPRGVCGQAAALCTTLIVDDVAEFPDYITEHQQVASEIAVPMIVNWRAEMVVKLAQTTKGAFDETDRKGLENIMRLIEKTYYR